VGGAYFGLTRLGGLATPCEGQKSDERSPSEIDYDLMMLQSLAALNRSEVPDDAVMTVAHPSQMAVFEVPHAMSMHWSPIPSILDRAESIRCAW
jgi:hypothetical protein